jgi:two-component system, sensor histidine kinase and response regulator
MASISLKAPPLPSRLDTPSSPVSPPAAAPGKLTLLIVDDEEGPRQSLRIVFKNDYNVLVASNGPDAIELAARQPVHVAVLDILMQGMSGVEVLRKLKDLDPLIEVVMLTAYETLETARQSLRHGASDYLNKPFDIPTMRAAVLRAAQKYQAALLFKQSTAQLEALQHEINDQRMREELARTKGEIYASVLHDLNSPLTVISGFIDLINRSMQSAACVEGEQLASLKVDLRSLTNQVDRCIQISRRYLSFLKAGGDGGGGHYTGVRQVLMDLQDLLAKHPCTKGHQLIVHDFEPDVAAQINGTDFLQILLNLTINALQSTDKPHCVEVRGKLLEQPLDLTTLQDGVSERFINREGFRNRPPLIAISVGDTGPGIATPVFQRMFEEHFSTKGAGQGTGLGLSIVKRLVKAAEGGIQFQTVLGEGAEFTVLLQIAQA